MKTIQVSDEFHSYLAEHGKFKDTMEDILIRLIGVDKMKSFTGDRETKTYSVDDVDTKKTKIKRIIPHGTGRGVLKAITAKTERGGKSGK